MRVFENKIINEAKAFEFNNQVWTQGGGSYYATPAGEWYDGVYKRQREVKGSVYFNSMMWHIVELNQEIPEFYFDAISREWKEEGLADNSIQKRLSVFREYNERFHPKPAPKPNKLDKSKGDYDDGEFVWTVKDGKYYRTPSGEWYAGDTSRQRESHAKYYFTKQILDIVNANKEAIPDNFIDGYEQASKEEKIDDEIISKNVKRFKQYNMKYQSQQPTNQPKSTSQSSKPEEKKKSGGLFSRFTSFLKRLGRK